MKKIICCLFLLSGLLPALYAQDKDYDVYPYWNYSKDVSNNLYNQLKAVALSQLDLRKSNIDKLKTKEDWMARQKEVKETLMKIFGPFPAKTPLNPVITGKIKREDFTVEKLYFESRPGFYVTGAIFIPKKAKGKAPAILYCCGHSNNGFRSESYQHHILNFVKKGFIVLAFDPIGQGERIQYFDDKGVSIFNPTHEHSYPGAQSFISGISPANYFIWDGIRAIDYLLTRKEVDPKRIGITGRSGGGTQTAYIASVDERIVAAAPECYITSFEMLLRSRGPQDAEQNLMHSIYKSIDMSDLLVARVPAPTLMVTTTRDIFSIQGARNVFKEVSAAYTAFGSAKSMIMAEDDAEHASTIKNREATYAFFQKHLNNPGDSTDMDVSYFKEQELWVTSSGQIQQSIPSETLFSLNLKHTKSVLENKQNENISSATVREKAIALSGYQSNTPYQDYIFSGRIQKEGYNIEKYLVRGSGDYYIPLLRMMPSKGSQRSILFLDDKGKNIAANSNTVVSLVQKGFEVFIPDLSGIGELGGGYKSGDAIIQDTPLNVWFAGILINKSPLGLRVEEINAVAHFMKEISLSDKIIGIAEGTFCPDLTHANVITGSFKDIALLNPLITYTSIVSEKNYKAKYTMSAIAGVIGEYDLPDLISASTKQRILMINPVDASGNRVDTNTFDKHYANARKSFNQKGVPGNFSVVYNQTDMFAEIYPWLK